MQSPGYDFGRPIHERQGLISSYGSVQLPGRLQRVPGCRGLHGTSLMCYSKCDRGDPEPLVSRTKQKTL